MARLSLGNWRNLSLEVQEKFTPVCPEFVIELKSKSNIVSDLQEKIESCLRNGAMLACLIVPESETVYIYQDKHEVRTH